MGDLNLELEDLWVSKGGEKHSCDSSLTYVQMLQQQHGKWSG